MTVDTPPEQTAEAAWLAWPLLQLFNPNVSISSVTTLMVV